MASQDIDLDAPPETLRLNAVGDVYLARRVSRERGERFASAMDAVRDSDVTVGNIEMVINDWSSPHSPLTGATWAVSDPKIADELAWMGIGLASLANNHMSEFGAGGYASTQEALDRLDITHAGIGRNLGEARRAGYRDTPAGRVALLSATSSYMPDAPAAHPRADAPGRAGLNPLKFDTTYVVDQASLDAIDRMADKLGLDAQLREHRTWCFGKIFNLAEDGSGRSFMNQSFVAGEQFEIRSSMNQRDLDEHIKYIKEARRQADWVIVSVHCHCHDTAKDEPPQFLVEFARACIDAGADAFFGHGPHLLRGVEIYQDRPIFYSLGNFLLHLDMWEQQPADAYDMFGLPPEATVADLYDKRGNGRKTKWFTDSRLWEGVIAQCELRKGKPPIIRAYPVELGMERPRPNAGTPRTAVGEDADRILANLAKLSEPFGTQVINENGIGLIRKKS
jgi:poly-gamma-glutamate synthesis protein (capsule biosynthesis protein)